MPPPPPPPPTSPAPAAVQSPEPALEPGTPATLQDEAAPPLDGYARLAASMGAHASMCIFRRFRTLRAFNLLRLQAELHDLEQQLEDVWREDKESGDAVRMGYVHDFWLMRQRSLDYDNTQLELLKAIARVLGEYDAALDAMRKVGKDPPPSKSDVKFLRDWLALPGQGDNFLCGAEDTIWDNDADLLTMLPERGDHTDRFSNFLHGRLLDLYHGLMGQRRRGRGRAEGGIAEYSDGRIRAVSNGVAAALSAVIPMAMVLALYYAKRMEVRLGLLFVFTTVFAVTLSVFTGAKKVEVFGAVAAFAAVEVVFVGSVLAG